MSETSPTRDAASRPERIGPTLPAALGAELEAGHWDYPWRLGPGVTAPVSDPGARQAAWTLERMLEELARDALALAGDGAAGLDLACGEGRLAHRLLEWRARRVVGVESRPTQLRRSALLRHHFALPAAALELRAAADLAELAPAERDRFDVVLLVGIVDQVDDGGALIRLARACTRGVCVVETGSRDRGALAREMLEAGFASVRRVPPPLDADRRYVLGERAVLLARSDPAP